MHLRNLCFIIILYIFAPIQSFPSHSVHSFPLPYFALTISPLPLCPHQQGTNYTMVRYNSGENDVVVFVCVRIYSSVRQWVGREGVEGKWERNRREVREREEWEGEVSEKEGAMSLLPHHTVRVRCRQYLSLSLSPITTSVTMHEWPRPIAALGDSPNIARVTSKPAWKSAVV